MSFKKIESVYNDFKGVYQYRWEPVKKIGTFGNLCIVKSLNENCEHVVPFNEIHQIFLPTIKKNKQFSGLLDAIVKAGYIIYQHSNIYHVKGEYCYGVDVRFYLNHNENPFLIHDTNEVKTVNDVIAFFDSNKIEFNWNPFERKATA